MYHNISAAWCSTLEHGALLWSMVLYFGAWCSTLEHGTLLWSMVLYFGAWCSTLEHGALLWSMVLYFGAWCSTLEHGALLWSMVLYFGAWCSTLEHGALLWSTILLTQVLWYFNEDKFTWSSTWVNKIWFGLYHVWPCRYKSTVLELDLGPYNLIYHVTYKSYINKILKYVVPVGKCVSYRPSASHS